VERIAHNAKTTTVGAAPRHAERSVVPLAIVIDLDDSAHGAARLDAPKKSPGHHVSRDYSAPGL
jgi:hypothetical protein